MNNKQSLGQYFWQVTSAHTIAYWLAGAFAFFVIDYGVVWSDPIVASFYRPVDEPIIFLGPVLNAIRGLLIALVLLPLRKTFFEEKYGLRKLAVVYTGLTVFLTFAAAWSSFEGYIYLKLPLELHLIGYIEGAIWLSLFFAILFVSIKFAHRKIVTILSIILFVFIIVSGILGFMSTLV